MRSSDSAFKLVELLAVMAIIAIFAAILVPDVQSALDRAKTIYCASNPRQQGAALNGFAMDRGEFPESIRVQPEDRRLRGKVAWGPLLLPYLDNDHLPHQETWGFN